MKKLLVLFLCFFSFDVYAKTTYQEATFVRCVDGDTAVFNVDGTDTKYRFLAIDTPETVHPTKEVEAYGKNASEYTCNKLTNATSIILESESSNTTDKYGRSLAWIWVDGSLLQDDLIKAGYAKVAYIYGTYKYTESLCLDQSEAYTNKFGLWSEEDEEGYCSTIDLTDITYNIYFNQDSEENSEEDNDDIDEYETIEKTVDNINNTINEITDSENSTDIFTYIILGISFIVFIYKELKK